MSAETNLRIWPVIIALVLITAVPTFAGKIIYVDDDGPADFTNIQAAIDDANHGDTVEVRPGTYTGDGNRDIDFLGKAITIRSVGTYRMLYENEIKYDKFWITEDQQTAIATFSSQDVQPILYLGEVELTITGQLTDGSLFEAKDIIQVIDKGGGKPGNGLGHPLRE